ncbi:hypothetical protein CEXT_334391 [Caerostris extrusa]|uniref:Uncharacterized protein n=1 Tax=Caerostris extrusa TaxID=172846 RepID=A0AAV4XKX2_CAEEX|nr:hypothetical protein CEXT_334391 [Caerostris extrusa]
MFDAPEIYSPVGGPTVQRHDRNVLLCPSDSPDLPPSCLQPLPQAMQLCPQVRKKKVVFCTSGNLTLISSLGDGHQHPRVDHHRAAGTPQHLTIGRIFLKFTNLRQSGSPVGPGSGYRRQFFLARTADENSGSQLQCHQFSEGIDFNGLKNLQELDLSDNIFAAPSAPFRHL